MSHSEKISTDVHLKLQQSLCRLARFGANITDAHSCFILLPPMQQTSFAYKTNDQQSLILTGYHSLSREVVNAAEIQVGNGLIGWVAQHNKAIHVSPFEHDSRTLGVYSSDCLLKSLIGIPIPMKHRLEQHEVTGVIVCDSKKSYAFSKLQGKLLNDLAQEIAHTVTLTLNLTTNDSFEGQWEDFLLSTEKMIQTLGRGSIEVMRVCMTNFDEIEKELGATICIEITQQMQRLVRQALPPHYAFTVLPNGDMLVCLDNMMSSFYENKIKAISKHIARQEIEPSYKFLKQSLAYKECGNISLEEIISNLKYNENEANINVPQARGRKTSRRGPMMETVYEFNRA